MAGYQLSPFDIGQIKTPLHHGLKAADITRILLKPDGKTYWSDNAIQAAVAKLEAQPEWRGDREAASGAPRQTSAKEDRAIVNYVLKNRGRSKVTMHTVTGTAWGGLARPGTENCPGCPPSLSRFARAKPFFFAGHAGPEVGGFSWAFLTKGPKYIFPAWLWV